MAAEINGVKPKFSLLNHNVINRMCYIMTINEKKHAGDHYQKTKIDKRAYIDKVWRHLVDFINGKVDDESGENPLIHAMCDIMILVDAESQESNTCQKNIDTKPDIVHEALSKLQTI